MSDVEGKFAVDDAGQEQVELVIEEEQPQAPQSPEEEKPGSSEELKKLIEELNLLKGQQTGTKEVLEGIKTMLEKVSRPETSPTPQAPPPPKEDYGSFRKRIEELMVTDPVKGLEEMLNRYVQDQIVPAFQQLAGQTTATTLATSRALAQQDTTNRMVMEKWGKEVEEQVKVLPPGPDIYDRACKQVAINHLGEIIQLQMKEMERSQQQQVPPPKGAVPPTTMSGGSGAVKKVVKLTPWEYEEARLLGVDPLVYKQMKEVDRPGRK